MSSADWEEKGSKDLFSTGFGSNNLTLELILIMELR